MKNKKSILFLIPCGSYIPSGRRRVLDYISRIQKNGYKIKIIDLHNPKLHRLVFLKSSYKILFFRHLFYLINIIHSWLMLLRVLLEANFYNIVFIQWVAPFSIWIKFLKCLNNNIIYDIDDAVFINNKNKVLTLLKNSVTVIAGSHYIFDYAKKYNKNTFLLPTSVPVEKFYINRLSHNQNKIRIGWVGGFSTALYLKLLINPLNKLAINKPDIFEWCVIGVGIKQNIVKSWFTNVPIIVIPYIHNNKIPKLISTFDIGVMPLINGTFEKGKCALKALEYMASAIPVVLSPVGENLHIITENENGYFADTENEWFEKLDYLIENKEVRLKMGLKGRKTVEEKYSTEICYKKLNRLLKNFENKNMQA